MQCSKCHVDLRLRFDPKAEVPGKDSGWRRVHPRGMKDVCQEQQDTQRRAERAVMGWEAYDPNSKQVVLQPLNRR